MMMMKSKQSRVVQALSAKLFALGALATAAPAAFAAGWITAFSNVTALGRAGATTVTVIFFMAGLIALGYAGKLLWEKGGERGEDIKAGRIIFTMIGGTVMVALAYIALQTVLTMGGTAADIGAVAVPK